MTDLAHGLESRVEAISFSDVDEIEVATFERGESGWTITEIDVVTEGSGDYHDGYITEMNESPTVLDGHLCGQLSQFWPRDLGRVDIDGLTAAEAVDYLIAAEIAKLTIGDGFRVNGVWCDSDGHTLTADPEN